jgi:hypothetical protein
MSELVTGVVKWLPVWAPALAAFAVGAATLFLVFRNYFPRPTVQQPAASVEVGRDSEGPFLSVKLRLRNPGSCTIYHKGVVLRSEAFGEIKANPYGLSNVPPEQASPRPDFLSFRARVGFPRPRGRKCFRDVVAFSILYKYSSGPLRCTRTLRLSASLPARRLRENGLLEE